MLKLLRLIILRPPRVDFTPLGSLPAPCFLPLVEVPAVAGMHPGRPCVSPARHLTGVAASDLPRISRGPEPIHTSLGLYCRWTRSEWQWFPVVLLGPQKKKGPGVSACRHAHTSGNRSGTHYVLLLSEGALTCQRSLFPPLDLRGPTKLVHRTGLWALRPREVLFQTMATTSSSTSVLLRQERF